MRRVAAPATKLQDLPDALLEQVALAINSTRERCGPCLYLPLALRRCSYVKFTSRGFNERRESCRAYAALNTCIVALVVELYLCPQSET